MRSKVDLRASSRARLEGVLRSHVLPTFGSLPLSAVTNAHVRGWVSQMLANGLSPATVRKAYGALQQMMAAAVADRRIAFNPCQHVPLPAENSSEQRFFSPEQVTLADCIHPRFRALVYWLHTAGCVLAS
jgi:site-specific recombinase XerD